MKSYEIIRALENEPSKNAKEDIIRAAFLAGNREFFVGAKMAYNRLVTYGVKQVIKINDEDDGIDGEATFGDFAILAEKLRLRQLTGHAARDAIDGLSERFGIAEWNDFYRRVLLKDFKAGVTESTINKALKSAAKVDKSATEYLVPVYGCQLAPSESYNRKTIGELRGKRLIDIKYDGMRLNTVLDKETGTVTQYTRAGLICEKFPHLIEPLTALMNELPVSVMLDGEIVGASFRALMRQQSLPKGEGDTSDSILMLFDIVPLADFRAGEYKVSQADRHQALCDLQESGLLAKHMGDKAMVLTKVAVDLDTEEGQAELARMFDDVMAKREIDPKVEGLMAKDPNAPYRCKRWAAWEKVKPFVDASLTVVGLEKGGDDTKNANALGALICEGMDGDRFIRVKVGSGMTQDERQLWWDNPDLVLGMIAEVEAHEFSQDEKSEGTNNWSMRHPRLKGWRGTKPGEKL